MESDRIPLNKIYKQSFFGRRKSMLWRVPIVCGAISQVLDFQSVIDVGCAIGDLVQGFHDLNKHSFGMEGSREALPHLVIPSAFVYWHDLRERLIFDTPRKFDLVLCLEVAEHIEKEYASIFVENLITLSNGSILISAAPPGQGGHHHVNCMPVEYWDNMFSGHGLVRDDTVVDRIKKKWIPYRKKAGIKAYDQNLHYYHKKSNTEEDSE